MDLILTNGVVGLLGVRTVGDFNPIKGLELYADLRSVVDPNFKPNTANFLAAGDMVANLSITLVFALGEGLKQTGNSVMVYFFKCYSRFVSNKKYFSMKLLKLTS